MTDGGRIVRLYLDTNVFVRFIEGDDDLSIAIAGLFFAGPRLRDPRVATSELTLAEVSVKPYREQNEHLLGIYNNWIVRSDFLEVAAVSRRILVVASMLRAQHRALKLPDAIHLATAIWTHSTHLLTGDRRLSGRYEVRSSLSNLRWLAGHGAVEALQLDDTTVERIAQDFQK